MAAVTAPLGSYTLPASGFTRTGYTFTGWRVDNAGAVLTAGVTITLSVNVTLYAQWEADTAIPNNATVNFNANGGTGSMMAVTAPLGSYTLPASGFTRAGYTFTGWRVDNAGAVLTAGATITLSVNVTLYAQWEVNPPTPPRPPSTNDRDDSDSERRDRGRQPFTSPPETASVFRPIPTSTGTDATLIDNAMRAALATATATSVTPRFTNISAVSPAALARIVNTAEGRSVMIHFDSMLPGGIVDVRLFVNPDDITSTINVSGSTVNAAAQDTARMFETFFANSIRTISLGQQGRFDAEMHIAARVSLTGMDVDNLYFYSYNPATHTFVRIQNPRYWVDTNGYLRFNTWLGNIIVISSGPLSRSNVPLSSSHAAASVIAGATASPAGETPANDSALQWDGGASTIDNASVLGGVSESENLHDTIVEAATPPPFIIYRDTSSGAASNSTTPSSNSNILIAVAIAVLIMLVGGGVIWKLMPKKD